MDDALTEMQRAHDLRRWLAELAALTPEQRRHMDAIAREEQKAA